LTDKIEECQKNSWTHGLDAVFKEGPKVSNDEMMSIASRPAIIL